MTSIRFYVAVFGLLMILSTTQAILEFQGILEEAYTVGLVVILALSFVKALFVAGYYQHLRSEPRSVSYLVASSLLVVVALTTAAAYSIL
ncbi:cytochrome C oxidase subunit IV family protein [Halobacteriales archaeon Cl-PHB]